jgi:sulfite exporter TauE/SafE
MLAYSFSASAGEALVLGLATGPVCLASCGPVVLPWMLAQPEGVRAHGRQLSVFLAARLAGYLVFATAAWFAGAALPRSWAGRSWVFGGIELLLAVALIVYAAGWPRRRRAAKASSGELVQISDRQNERRLGAVALGFLTGINLCPPFLVAGVRAAEQASLIAALAFFVFFFVGTAVWFLPYLSLGLVRRAPAVVTVARMVAVLLACWYLFSGASILMERAFYG